MDLTVIDKISAFSGLDHTQHAVNKENLRKISSEIAKPLRRSDSSLDYLPTQYICDFIKSVENIDGSNAYSGIQYRSIMRKKGYNLAIFDQSVFKCDTVEVYDVTDLYYKYDKIR